MRMLNDRSLMSFWKSDTFWFGLTAGVAVMSTAALACVHGTRSCTCPKQSDSGKKSCCGSSSSGKQEPTTKDAAGIECIEESRVLTTVLHELNKAFSLPQSQLIHMTNAFIESISKGLAQDGQTVKMIPSFVTRMPTGQERGYSLALDVGGSNFRVCWVTLNGNASDTPLTMIQKKYTIPEDLKNGKGSALFDFFAECVQEFFQENTSLGGVLESAKDPVKLGFTFSFPCQQTALNKGALIRWTKGFTCPDVVGQDPVQLLQDAFSRKKLNIQVAALVNDTVGTLVAHAYTDPRTQMGVILGTGSNAAYVEKVKYIPKWNKSSGSPGKKGAVAKKTGSSDDLMLINMEWGAFDEEVRVLPRTKYDIELDESSPHPHTQPFEKMISGLYLGELVRLALVDLHQRGLFYASGELSEVMQTPYALETAYTSQIVRDKTESLSETKQILSQKLKLSKATYLDCQIVYNASFLVGQRAARLSTMGIAGVLKMRMSRGDLVSGEEKSLENVTIGIDGSVFEHYPDFKEMMQIALEQILGRVNATRISLVQARDGSGQGAALIAALAAAK